MYYSKLRKFYDNRYSRILENHRQRLLQVKSCIITLQLQTLVRTITLKGPRTDLAKQHWQRRAAAEWLNSVYILRNIPWAAHQVT